MRQHRTVLAVVVTFSVQLVVAAVSVQGVTLLGAPLTDTLTLALPKPALGVIDAVYVVEAPAVTV